MAKIDEGLISGFLESVRRFPQRPALEVNQRTFTYEALGQIAGQIAGAIREAQPQNDRLGAFLAYRSLDAYAAVLGILASGRGYVPLHPGFPIERTARMLNMSGTDILLVGRGCLREFETLLPLLDKPMRILCHDLASLGNTPQRYPQHRYITFGEQEAQSAEDLAISLHVDADAPAYLLFTSGSTGVPKGVPVSHANVMAYVAYSVERYGINEDDRFSQMFDMTFDLSVHDMFLAWERGACVFCVPEKYLMSPSEFIQTRELTMWFSVPSVAMFLSGYRMLRPHAFPSLRYSLFCGEALSAMLAQEWQKAAPQSVLENLYGPTETTIAIANYRWDAQRSPDACLNGVVPIGWMFSGQRAAVIPLEEGENGARFNEDEVRALISPLTPAEEAGELCLSGSQVTHGYLNNAEKTRSQFIRIPALGNETWYRTGDLVKQGEDGCLYYLGRIDNQVKILGHRVELGEIDAVLREAAGTENAVSLAFPVKEGRATGVVAFVAGSLNRDEKDILAVCQQRLPDYMVPRKIYHIEQMPLNVNGKIDRLQLQQELEKK